MIPKKIIYNGVSYYIQTTGRYYQHGNKTKKDRLLHRIIWIEHNGPIPEGMHIHHINGNWQDNDINNLELVWPKEHMSKHSTERMKDPAKRKIAVDALTRARPLATKWHRSKEGRAWHKEHGKRCWDDRKTETAICSICESPFETYYKDRAGTRFCSKPCEAKESYLRYKTATANCAWCGKPFVYNKFRNQKCCSRVCGNRLRGSQTKKT